MPDTVAPPAPSLRFTIGARPRDTGVFYDESKVLAATSQVMPEAAAPPGDWLQHITVMVDITTATNAAAVALQPDAPWSLFAEVAFLDAGGNTVHALKGYNWYLANLLGGFEFQTDPTTSTFYTALTTGAGATAGSGRFLLKVPVQIIDRDAVGAYPNAASNAVTRIRFTLAPIASVYSTAPTNPATIRIRCVSTGLVLPTELSPAGTRYAQEPLGAGTFQQWSQLSYDLTAGARTIAHNRKGQTYRTLLFIFRTAAGARSDVVADLFRFGVDDVNLLRGPYDYCKHESWQKQLVLAANWPTGVIQVSLAHEWDGKVGGEMRDMWIPTAPGSKVEIELNVLVTGTLEVVTNEVVPAAGSGVLRV